MGHAAHRLRWCRLHGLSPLAQGSGRRARRLIESIHEARDREAPSGGFLFQERFSRFMRRSLYNGRCKKAGSTVRSFLETRFNCCVLCRGDLEID